LPQTAVLGKSLYTAQSDPIVYPHVFKPAYFIEVVLSERPLAIQSWRVLSALQGGKRLLLWVNGAIRDFYSPPKTPLA
jgi:hypothetical protein